MKKNILLILALFFVNNSIFGKIYSLNDGYFYKYKIKTCFRVDNLWGEWKSWYDNMQVTEDCIILFPFPDGHPARFYCKINIGSYVGNDGDWDVYDGTIEYYITDDFPDSKSIMYKQCWINPDEHNINKGQSPCIKRIAKAIIKKTKKDVMEDRYVGSNFWGPKYERRFVAIAYCYNIFFEGVAFGLSYTDPIFGANGEPL